MTNKQAFTVAAEKAGINIQYYIDTYDETYFQKAVSYIRAAGYLLKEMDDENNYN